MSAVMDYVCIDLETTGLSPKTDRIIEVGAARVRQGRVTDTYQRLIDPRMQLEERIEELTGISNSDLKGQPALEEILPELEVFLGEDILVGHRIGFDYSFLKRAFVNGKKEFEKQGIDTLKLARALVTDCESKRLESLCRYFSINHQAHRALGDVLATVDLYQKLAEDYWQEERKEIFLPRQLIYRVKKESPITRAQLERLQRVLEKHQVKPSVEIASLTRNEASRYLDQLYAVYGR
ncbi:MAG: 3'-5' exonuclease [Lachnospiraceae bacterium]|nr:3'-5' exonuclease [Lachnospiraceae bacterium]MDD7049910.1 3'-5' exonuclease [Lachnospiraceae bacterium]MDY4098048.1 3'-5' exonuclease [Lachnospiraceae bacterium]